MGLFRKHEWVRGVERFSRMVKKQLPRSFNFLVVIHAVLRLIKLKYIKLCG